MLRQSAAAEKREISLVTFGERRQHGITMGNGFVAGNFQRAANGTGRTNELFGHPRIHNVLN